MIYTSLGRSATFLCALVLAAPLTAVTSVTLSPTTLAFGKQVQNTTSPALTATLKNVATAPLTISTIAVTGSFAQAGGTCPLSPSRLAKGASCTILVTFTPTALGPAKGTLTVTDSATNSPQTAALTGAGVAPTTVSPTSLTFPKVPIGETSSPMTVSLANNQQSTALSFTGIATSGDFAISSNTCGASLSGLASCSVGVTFSPTAGGTRTGSLTFSDNASNSPQTVSLSGTGLAPALLSIAVTPPSPSIVVGGTAQFAATGTYSNNSMKNLTASVVWSTSPPGIAGVNASGLGIGLAPGVTTVTATLGAVSGSTPMSVNQVFFPTGSLNNARYYHTATLLDNGSVLMAGGIGPVPDGGTGALGDLAAAELFNPAGASFAFTGNLNTARDQHSATLLNDGTVLIAGGSGSDGALASAEVYDPATLAFNATGALHTARYQHTATMLPNGSVLFAGGYGVSGVLSSAEVYNPSTGGFTVTGGLNFARFAATATLLPNGLVLIAGGANAVGPLASAELYDPSTGIFTPSPAGLNVARSGATATLLNTGQILIASGYNYLLSGPLTSAELYDPTAGTFTLTGSLGSTSWLGTATLLNNGGVLVAGSVLNAAPAEIFGPNTSAFSGTGVLITPGDLRTATLLLNGTVLIAGGHSNASNAVLAAAEFYVPLSVVPADLTAISLTPGNPTLAAGSSLQFIATGTFSDNSTSQLFSVTWTTSNPAAATVTNDGTNSGVAYGVAAGSTIIGACTGTLCGSMPLTVTGAAAPIH